MECLATGYLTSGMADQVTMVQDFESLARQFRPKVFRFILASTKDRESAENLTEECLPGLTVRFRSALPRNAHLPDPRFDRPCGRI